MECYNCGHKLPSDADRCPRCGQRFKPRAASQPPPAKLSLLDRLKGKLGKKDGEEAESDPP
jgi:predicted amidophosphoribosyltransferase